VVALTQLRYLLQAFDDVNKGVSRRAANLPMIRAANLPMIRDNLAPMSFVGVARELYTKALLAIYELEDHAMLKEL